MWQTPTRVSDAEPSAGLVVGRRLRRWLGPGVVLALVAAPAGWFVTDHLERDDDFCNACHLSADVPLHIDVRRDFDAPVAASLAGAHGLESVDDRDFRCIDCHGGVGLVGRARVKLLAAKDSLVYLTGRFDEPEGMNWPLWDQDCRKCHTGFDVSDYESWESPRFHQLPVHNAELGVDCVECHRVHDPGGPAAHHFLRAERVQTQCARCHAEFEELAHR